MLNLIEIFLSGSREEDRNVQKFTTDDRRTTNDVGRTTKDKTQIEISHLSDSSDLKANSEYFSFTLVCPESQRTHYRNVN